MSWELSKRGCWPRCVRHTSLYPRRCNPSSPAAASVCARRSSSWRLDDTIDEAMVRRGQTTLNASWNRGATILAGDFLFARAAALAAETNSTRVATIFANALMTICDGELRQMLSLHDWRGTREDYYQRIYSKTASLFASASEHLGKPVGSDLHQGIATLPVYHYLQNGGREELVESALDRDPSDPACREEAVRALVAGVVSSGAIASCRREARRLAEQAVSAVAGLDDGPYQRALCELADFVVAREV
jgi:geranylgeranyl pyrophosphate synthase